MPSAPDWPLADQRLHASPPTVPLATSVPLEVMVLGGPPDDDGFVVEEHVEVSLGTFTELAPEPEPEPEPVLALPPLDRSGTDQGAAAIYLRYNSEDRVFL